MQQPNGIIGTPDGKTLYVADHSGRKTYLTSDSVFVFSPEGKPIERIDFPAGPSNVCFGGADRKTLFATALHAAYTLRMLVRGADRQ